MRSGSSVTRPKCVVRERLLAAADGDRRSRPRPRRTRTRPRRGARTWRRRAPRNAKYLPSATMLAPTPPTTIGIASGRKSSGRISSRALPATAIAPVSVPTAQIPMSASSDGGDGAPADAVEEDANAGSATTSATPRNANTESVLASQIALRSEGASTSASKQALVALGDERPRRARGAR